MNNQTKNECRCPGGLCCFGKSSTEKCKCPPVTPTKEQKIPRCPDCGYAYGDHVCYGEEKTDRCIWCNTSFAPHQTKNECEHQEYMRGCEGCRVKSIPHSTPTTEEWEEKIRKDYKGIISDGQIEATIDYWRDFIKAERQKAKEEERATIKERIMKQIHSAGGIGGLKHLEEIIDKALSANQDTKR